MDKIANYFEKEFDLSKIEKLKLKYSIEVLFNDISKLVILLILFIILGKTIEFVYSVITLFLIRPFTGGLHFKNYTDCLLFTCLFFLIAINLNVNIPVSKLTPYFYLFSSITILTIVPIINENRPKHSKKKQLHFKLTALAVVSIHFAIFMIMQNNLYLISSIWIFTLQSIQLLVKKGVDTFEKK